MKQINIGPAELETFLAVVARGSFSRAAEDLGLSQPTISGRIQRLEAVLGLPLFNRTTRRVVVTEAGERLRQRAEHTLVELRELVQDFHEEGALRTGRLRIAGTPAISATVIPLIARRFLRLYPGISLNLFEDYVLAALERLSASTVDLAIVPIIQCASDVKFEPLFADEFLLIVPRDHPLSREHSVDFKEISRHPLLTRPAGSASRLLLEHEFRMRGLELRPAFESSSLFVLLGLVEAGLGLSLLPQILLARLNLSRVAVVRLGDRGIFRQIGIATRQGHVLSPAARALRKMLKSSYGLTRSAHKLTAASKKR